MEVRSRRIDENARLVEIWLGAVRATHHFLGEDEIQILLPLVRDEYVPELEILVAIEDGVPVGFVGLDGSKVEMLFVDPDRHGRGIGKTLLNHVAEMRGSLRVDANEQNPGAVAFYLKSGFKQVGRSELDGSGKPFPLLHMAQGG